MGVGSVASAGLSLGEYNHLVDIGAIGFEDALRLVDMRGALYDEGPTGMMAAVFPVARAELAALIAQSGGEVWISVERGKAPRRNNLIAPRALPGASRKAR